MPKHLYPHVSLDIYIPSKFDCVSFQGYIKISSTFKADILCHVPQEQRRRQKTIQGEEHSELLRQQTLSEKKTDQSSRVSSKTGVRFL